MRAAPKNLFPRLAVCCMAAIATTALAQPLPVFNAGFEADSVPTAGAFLVLQPAGWDLYDPLGIVNQHQNSVGVIRPFVGQSFFPGGVPGPLNAALVFLADTASGAAGLEQTLAAVLQPLTLYTLNVEIGNIASGTSVAGSSDNGGIFYNLDGFPGYRIELLAGGTVLASDETSTGLIPEGEWRTAALSFATGASHPQLGQPLGIRLINRDLPGTFLMPAIEVDFDNVSLVASVVPEPTTLALWLLGLAGLRLAARRS